MKNYLKKKNKQNILIFFNKSIKTIFKSEQLRQTKNKKIIKDTSMLRMNEWTK